MSARLMRGMPPLATALAVASGCLLSAAVPAAPARAAPAASMPVVATPDLASEWWLTALSVPQAWRASGIPRAKPGAGVTVAVLSTGVDATHPDLAGDVVTGPDLSRSGVRPGDPYWGLEGTAVASLVAGHGHGTGGTAGITGVAPGARVLSLRVTLEYNDPRSSDAGLTRALPDAIAAGIRYAVSHGASVIALPLDPGTLGPDATGDPVAAGGSAAERAAVALARADGAVLVAPAGDNGASTGTVNYPAAYPGVLAVGATGRGGQLAPFSLRRPYVALTAPGSGLRVAASGGGYDTISTTDMSAALAAAVAALIRAKFPRLSASQVASAIERGATPAASGNPATGTGAGALDAAGALTAAAGMAATIAATPRPAAQSGSPAAASPASAAPAAPLAGTLSPRASDWGATREASSVLRDVAIGAGILTAVLTAALALARSRRRHVGDGREPGRRQDARRQAGSGAGAARHSGGFAAVTDSFSALGSHGAHAARRGNSASDTATTGSQRAVGGNQAAAAASPRALRSGTLGSMGRPAQARVTSDAPPWAPARSPEALTSPPAGGPRPAFPQPEAAQPAGLDAMIPPWERVSGPLAAAPLSADWPTWPKVNTGPMYVWNPATNSGPFPAADHDQGHGPTPESDREPPPTGEVW